MRTRYNLSGGVHHLLNMIITRKKREIWQIIILTYFAEQSFS